MRDYPTIARKISRTLFFTQVIVSSGLIMLATVNTIVGAELSGRDQWAGVPTAVFLLASALGALIWGVVMERRGRRTGLVFGLALGAAGAVVIPMVIGFGFGFVLEQAGFGDSRKLAAQFYLHDMRVFKVMFTAIITAMLLLFWGVALQWVNYDGVFVNPTFLWSGVIGGFILGLGFIIGGF